MLNDTLWTGTTEAALATAWRCRAEGRLLEAEAIGRHLLRQHPHAPEILHLMGSVARLSGQPEQAVSMLDQAVTAGLRAPGAFADLALSLAQLGRTDEAERWLSRTTTTEQVPAEAAAIAAEVMCALGRPAEAADYAGAAIAAMPGLEAAHLVQGRAFLDLGNGTAAAASFRQALAINPNAPDTVVLLAIAWMVGADPWAAIGACRDGLARFPDLLDHLTAAIRSYQDQGKLKLAEAAARTLLLLRPDDPDVLARLATIVTASGKKEEGDEIARFARQQAARWKPLIERAVGACQAGRLDEAGRLCAEVLAMAPGHSDALQLLGGVHALAGNPAEGVRCLERAVMLAGDVPAWLSNLAAALRDLGRDTEAEAVCRRALAQDPNHAMALTNLGSSLTALGQFDEALAAFDRAIALSPGDGMPRRGRADLLSKLGRDAEAEEMLTAWLANAPHDADALHMLAMACHRAGQLAEAITLYRSTLSERPLFAEAHTNLGLALQADGRSTEAINHLRKAVTLKPSDAGFHNNLSLALLQRGEFEEGLAEHEWRLGMAHFQGHWRPGRKWDGAAMPQGTLLLIAEQGMGDTIQLVRYAALARQRVGRVIVQCQPQLMTLIATAPGVDAVVELGHLGDVSYDAWIPLLSLPLVFGTRVNTIPASPAYLSPSAEAMAKWASRIKAEGPGLRVGLAWAGNPAQMYDYRRSMLLASLAPLFDVPGTRFFSLQKGERASDIDAAGLGGRIIDLTPDISDFADSASIMAKMDVVISVCTATAHLAGALGRPTWVLLSKVAHWVWLQDRKDSPWYPTARLFRQKRHGDWNEVGRRLAHTLAREIERKAKP